MRSKSVAAVSMTLALILVAQIAAAQSAPKRNGSGMPPAPTVSRPSAPRVPAPPVPPPPPTTPPPAPELSPFAAGPSTYAPHYTAPLRARPNGFRSFSPEYGYAVPFADGVSALRAEPHDWPGDQLDTSGTLVLDVEPRIAQVYVDGFYLGTIDDFARTGVSLPAGRHRVELRAPGYEMLTIPVEIAAPTDGQPLRFRGALTALRTDPPLVIVPHRPETMYVIPGCYAGNRPPRQSALARGCDLALLRVLN